MIKVLVADDQVLIRAGLAALLRAAKLDVVGEAADGECSSSPRSTAPGVIDDVWAFSGVLTQEQIQTLAGYTELPSDSPF